MSDKKISDKNNFLEYIKKSKISILIIIFFTIFAFGERLLSNSFGIDSEHYLSSITDPNRWDWWISLSRWGLVLINQLWHMNAFSIFVSNYLTVVTMIVYAIMFNYLFYTYIKDEYKERYLKYQFIFPIIFLTNPIFAEQYNFLLQNFGVALGILMIPVSILLINRAMDAEKTLIKIGYYVISIIMMILSFSIYQSIILLYIVTVVACYLLKVLKDNDNNWKYLFKFIGIFAIAAGTFLIVSKLLNTSGTSYLQTGWSSSGVRQCIQNIYYCVMSMLKSETIFYNFGYILSLIAIVCIAIYLVTKKKMKIGILIAMLGLIVAPFYIMIVTGVDQYKRTQFNYSFVIGFVLMLSIVLISNKNIFSKGLKVLTLILAIGIAYIQSYTSAVLFYTADIKYQSDVELANRIVEGIEEKDWYEKDKDYTLIFLGKYEKNEKNAYIKGEIIGRSFFEFDYQYIYGLNERANAFLQILGYYFNKPSIEQFENAKEYVESENIKSWPNNEAITLVDNDKIIVRLSEEI